MSDTKERPIVLTADEVKAVLAGDKTQHRVPALTDEQIDAGYKVCYGVAIGQVIFTKDESDDSFDNDGYITANCPLGKVGDQLWVQEPTYTANSWDWFYAATDSLVECRAPYSPSDLHLPFDDEHQEYTGSISAQYLPRWASRALLEITDIRMERVQDISEADALAMGVKSMSGHAWGCALDKQRANPTGFKSPASFLLRMLWREWHGKDSWESYPWVWVIEFKAVKETSNG